MSHRQADLLLGFMVPPGYNPQPAVAAPLGPVGFASLVMFGAAVIVAIWCLGWWESQEDPRAVLRSRLVRTLVLGSARLAGGRQDRLLDEWTADLAGTPEEGRPLTSAQQLRYGRGCLWAAARLRSAHVLDDTLASTSRCAVATGGPVAVAAVLLVREEGLVALVMHADKLAYLGGLVSLAIRWARKRRGVTPKTRHR